LLGEFGVGLLTIASLHIAAEVVVEFFVAVPIIFLKLAQVEVGKVIVEHALCLFSSSISGHFSSVESADTSHYKSADRNKFSKHLTILFIYYRN